MAPPFTAKRVSVPGLLSDQGLAEGIAALKGQTQQTATNAVATSGADMSQKIVDLDIQMPSPRTVAAPSQQPSSISLGGGLSSLVTPSAPTSTGFGMLTPEQGQLEQQQRIAQATDDAATAEADLVDKTRLLTDEQRAAIGLAPLTPADIERLNASAAAEAGYVAEAVERAEFIQSAPPPNMTWWLNSAQVGARAAAQTGTSALKYPFSAFEALTYLSTGIDVGKTAPRGWLDEVDAGLTKLLPGDPSRAKDFVTELSAGAGSFVPFLIAGYIGGAVGLPAGVTAGGLGAAATGNQMYEEAESFNAPMLQKAMALLLGTGLGATEAIPIDRMFMRADTGTGGLLRRMLANTTASTLEEFTQEFSQAIGEDMIARYGAGYDPDRALDMMSWLRQGAVGGIVGGVAGSVTTLVPGAGPGADQQSAAVEEVLTREQTRFDQIVGAEALDDGAAAGEGEVPAAGGATSLAAAPETAAPAVAPLPQPTVHDAVQQIVTAVAAPRAAPAVETATAPEMVLLDPAEPMSAVEVAPAVTTPEFKAWFGESKMVDETGAPLIVYHSTDAVFSEFKAGRSGLIFASPDRAFTTQFGVNTMPLYLRATNTFDVANEGALDELLSAVDIGKLGAELSAEFPDLQDAPGPWTPDKIREELNSGWWGALEAPEVQRTLKAKGYDSIVVDELGRKNYAVFDPTQIKSATGNSGAFDPANPDINAQVANPLLPTAQTIAAVQLEPADTTPLPAIEQGLKGPIPIVVQAAKAYANAVGLPHRRQREYVRVDTGRAARIAQAYADMPHQPDDPAVQSAYQAMADETIAQYQFVKATGLKIETIQPGQPDPYPNGPRDVLKDIASGHIWYFPTDQGFGSSEFDPAGNPLLEPTGEVSDNGTPMVVNDLFRVVHDFFGHGLEGAGFGARGEENAWQAHMRLFSAAAVPAMTSETRGQNSWVNYGPFGAQNRADPRNTVYADQKTGIMPSWTWSEGVADSQSMVWAAPVEADAKTFREALLAAKGASKFGGAVTAYSEAKYGKMKTFVSSDGLAGFALDGDNIVSVFSRGGGRLRSIIDTAIANGGRKLDAFDTGTKDHPGLVQMYGALGFVETGRVSFDPKQAPAEWPAALGQPDVVFMEFDDATERMEAWEDKRAQWHAGSDEYFKNADGSPKVFYHGTEKGGFRSFDTSGNAKTQGTGAWFTPSRAQASSYGSHKEIGFVDYSEATDKLLAGETVTIGAFQYDVAREEDGAYVRQKGTGLAFEDGPFASEQEVREFLNDQFEDDARQSGVYAVYLRAKNPLIVDWGGASWMEGPMETVYVVRDTDGNIMETETFFSEDEAEYFVTQQLEEVEAAGNEMELTRDDYFIEEAQQPGFQSTDDFVREMRENWGDEYDAVVLQNVEGSGPNGYGAGIADEVVIWDETSIKSTANLGGYDPNDPDILRMVAGTSSTRQPYSLEPTRPARGVPDQPNTPQAPEDAKLTQISANFRKLLGLTVRHGRLVSGKTAMGEYNRKTATVRLRTWTDLSTLVHEGGHALNDTMTGPLEAFVTRNEAEIMRLAVDLYAGDLSNAPAKTRRREGFAEFFRVYTLTPDYARNKFGKLTADFEATIKAADPSILDGLNSIATQFKAWLQLPSAKLIRSMVVDGRREQGINAAIKELKDLGFKSWFEEYTRRAVDFSVNRYAPLNRLVTDLLNQAETNAGTALDLKRAEDPRTLVRLARNSGSRAMVEVVDGVYGYKSTTPMSRGLRDAIMLSQGVDPNTTPGALDEERLKDFSAYIVARRAKDEYRRFEAGLIERPPIGASIGDVNRAIKDYEAQYKKSFTDAADIVHEFGMALWQKQYDAGLMSKETYLDGLERQFYAPLQRDMSDKKESFGASALTAGARSLVRQFRGSDRDIVDPIAVLMQKTFALEQLISENEVIKNLAVLADRAGRAGALVERIPATQVMGMTMSVEEAARQLSRDDSISPADAQDLMTILGASIKNGATIQLFRRDQVSTAGENVLFFWENGKPAAIQLKDGALGADVVNVLQAVGRENMPLFTELIAGTSTLFRTAITSWPDFLVVNYIRDQMSAWILNDVGFVPFVSGIKGMADEVRQKQWAKSYNAAQGIMGGMNVAALHEARIDQDITALRSKGYIAQAFRDKTPILGAIRGLAEVTSLSETGTRLGLYRAAHGRAVADGLSEYEASVEAGYIATDYMDFGLNGSRMTLARRTIPFLNAQLQGLYKMLRTFGADEVAQRKGLKFVLGAYLKGTKNMSLSRVEKDAINTGRAAWVKMASLGLISALLHFMFRDDPDYQEAGEYLRTTGWVIPMGDGRIFYIPKPFELALMANAVERGLEFGSGDSQAPGRFLRGAAMSLTPPTSPTAIQLAVELTANRDFFTGRDIVPTYMQALEPQLQYDNYTSSIAKWMGSTFGWSPLVVDHVLSGLGASAYRDISSALNAADPTRPSLDETDAPLIRRFVRDVRRGSVSAQDFWSQASQTTGRLERTYQTYKRFVEYGNDLAANQYLATLPADEKAYALLMTHFEADTKRLNPFYRARQVSTLVSGMRREMASELGLGDTTVKDLPDVFQMSASMKQQVDEVLSEIARREVRNTLIATGQAGWADKEILPIEPTLDMLLALSPDTYDEYQRRYKQRKIYDAQTVYDYWPEVRDRLNADGEFAVLSDVQAIAGVVF